MDLLKSVQGMSQEELKVLSAKLKEREAARVAAMSPDERAEYEREYREAEEYQNYLAEPVTVTRGELQMREDHFDMALEGAVEEAESKGFNNALEMAKPHLEKTRDERDAARADAERTRKNLTSATSSQGGTDRKLTEARKRIEELEAEVAKLVEERDAARLAYLKLLDGK